MSKYEDMDYGVEESDFEDALISDSENDPSTAPEKGNGNDGNGLTEAETGGQEDADEGADNNLLEKEESSTTAADESKGDGDAEKGEKATLSNVTEKDGMLALDDEARINIDGKPALFKELVNAYKTNDTWKKENTEKAMAIAKERKEFEKEKLVVGTLHELASLIKNDPEIYAEIKDRYGDNAEKLKLIEEAINADVDKSANPYIEQINELKKKIAIREQEDAYNAQRRDCQVKYNLTEPELKEVDNLIINKFRESNIALSYEDGYALWHAKKVLAGNNTVKKPVPPETGSVKKQTVTQSTPRRNNEDDDHDYGTTLRDFEGILL